MGWWIVAGVIALPVLEISLWIKAAQLMGFWSTLGLSILAVMIGTAILRRQGLAMLLNARAGMELGEMPLQAAFDGLCLAAAGLLLVLPGFLSDGLALLLLLPPVRAGLRRWLAGRMVVVQGQPPGAAPGPVIIDGDYTVVEPAPSSDTKRLEP